MKNWCAVCYEPIRWDDTFCSDECENHYHEQQEALAFLADALSPCPRDERAVPITAADASGNAPTTGGPLGQPSSPGPARFPFTAQDFLSEAGTAPPSVPEPDSPGAGSPSAPGAGSTFLEWLNRRAA